MKCFIRSAVSRGSGYTQTFQDARPKLYGLSPNESPRTNDSTKGTEKQKHEAICSSFRSIGKYITKYTFFKFHRDPFISLVDLISQIFFANKSRRKR